MSTEKPLPLSASDEAVEIPAEPDLRRSFDVPPQRVALPLKAERSGKQIVVFLVAAPAGALLLSCAAALLWLLAQGSSEAPPLATLLAISALLSVLAIFGVIIGGAGLICLYDFLRDGPLLIIDAVGLWDRRATGQTIPWSDISRAEIISIRGNISVRLKLHRPMQAHRSPFRFSAMPSKLFNTPDDELNVSVRFLSIRPYILAHSILALVKRHGGKAAVPDLRVKGV